MTREPDHYAVLDLPRNATDAEIKRRYRTLMRSVHPDANARDPDATRKAARINRAFETLGHPAKRREYDAQLRPTATMRRSNRVYAEWAEQDDWEDIVAEAVPPKRPPHVHDLPPVIVPEEIEVDAAELRESPRVRRRVRIENNCACTLTGDVSTSEPWVWGPVGKLKAGPGGAIEFDIEIVSSKVAFPGLSRVLFVANDWTGVIPVKISGYEPKPRRAYPVTESQYVRPRRRKWARR